MLTSLSEPLPQIHAFSMDGANPFCSTPPHTDPLPNLTPSCVSYGLSGSSRRSGRLQESQSQSPPKLHVTERRPHKPYHRPNSSPIKRQRASTDMVQMSQSLPSKLERTPEKVPLNEEQLDWIIASESISDKLKRPSISPDKPTLSSVEPTVTEQTYVSNRPNSLETRSLLAPDTAPKGWVIGPLFQSFKSKMASFTDIVMSPFKSNSINENELQQDEPSSVEDSKHGDLFEAKEEIQLNNQQTDLKSLTPKTETKLTFEDMDLTEKPDDLKAEHVSTDVIVPLQTPKPEVEATIPQSASEESKIFNNNVVEQSWSARTRNRQNRATPKTLVNEVNVNSVGDRNDVYLTKQESENLSESDCLVRQSIKEPLNESAANETPTSRSILDEAGLKKVKRTLNLSGQTGEVAKRKKVVTKTEQEVEEVVMEKGDLVQKIKPKRKEVIGGETRVNILVTKAITRANKKSKVGEPVVLTQNNDCNMDAKIVNSVDNGNEEPKSAKAKPKPTKKNKASSDLQTTTDITSKSEIKLVPTDVAEPLKVSQSKKSSVANKKRKAKEQVNIVLEAGAGTASSEMVEEIKVMDLNEKKEVTKGRKWTKKPKIEARETAELNSEDAKNDAATNTDAVVKSSKVKKGKNADPVYFEMTPFESNVQDVSALALQGLEQLENEVKKEESQVPKKRTRRVNAQRRKCRVISSRARKEVDSVTSDDTDLFKTKARLSRSLSCPEIPTLPLHESPFTPHFHSPPRSRSQPAHHQHHHHHHSTHHHTPTSSMGHHFHRSARRARRHTVCSIEVEREIAPLCLRKEVYPARRSPSPYDRQHNSPIRVLSPGASLSALASCFLSSPLAFLSKKSEGCRGSPIRASLSPAASSAAVSHCASPSLTSLLGSSMGQLPGFHLRTDTLMNASSDSSNSSVSVLVCEPEQRQSEEDDEDTSSSSHESEDLRGEEKAHSDSEIKLVKKDEEQRKVSSIKIRKALPKPQKNLTPMGLPKTVRVKKKEFSLEEIYTNKNFSKPPESRLETIFEVPLSRKNGSESWFGQRRIRRVMEFMEVGEVRKPKRPLVGSSKPAAPAPASRTRRGGTREEPVIIQDLDSLLCAKLEQLSLWLSLDEGS